MKVFREVARRFKITEVLVRLYAPDELKKALVNNQVISQARLKSRYKYSIQYWYSNKFKIYEGLKARKIFNKEVREETSQNITSLDGVIASAGKYVGRVRVILLPKELKEFRAGEILVAQMTSPDYVPAMKKAGAIITDKGGVTCHAAVVSRELGTPCVVGTQNATKVLKTGELVEVNANHNSVKILKK
jgi:phosphoenolpyruvate synthase/pyruvate phosphate dikinase